MSHTNTNQEPGNTVSPYEGAKRQYDQDYALSASRSYGGSSGRSSGSSEETVNPYEGADVEAMIRGASSEAEVQALIDDLLKYGYDADALFALYEELYGSKKSGGGSDAVGPGYPGLKNQKSQIAKY